MNNQELELKIKEIIAIKNYFDMVIAVKNFEKEYKTSEFYKATKQPLFDVIKNAKMYYMTQLDDIRGTLQSLIDGLTFEKFTQIIEQFGEMFSQENEDTLTQLQILKDLQA